MSSGPLKGKIGKINKIKNKWHAVLLLSESPEEQPCPFLPESQVPLNQ